MTATEPKVFAPNAVLIPESAIWKDNNGEHVTHDECTKLFIDGDMLFGNIFTKEQWEQDGKPSYVLRNRQYFSLDANEEEQPLVECKIELLPDMWCIKEDETKYWREDLIKKYGIKRIFGVYLFNAAKAVYCCEMTPSYERVFIHSQWEADEAIYDNEELREELYAEIDDGDNGTETFSYAHCCDLTKIHLLKVHQGDLPPEGVTRGAYRVGELVSVTEDDAIEEIREWRCNGDL